LDPIKSPPPRQRRPDFDILLQGQHPSRLPTAAMVRLSAVLSAALSAAVLPFASGAKILLAGDSTMAYSSSASRQGSVTPALSPVPR